MLASLTMKDIKIHKSRGIVGLSWVAMAVALASTKTQIALFDHMRIRA